MTEPGVRHDLDAALHEQSVVARVGELGLRNVEIDRILDEAVAGVASVLGTSLAAMLVWSPVRSDFSIRAAWTAGRTVPRRLVEAVRLPGGTDSLPGYAVLTGELVRSSDLGADERFRAKADAFGAPDGAALVAPVGWGQRIWGVLGAWTSGPRTWSDDDADFLRTLANLLGLVIFRRSAELDHAEQTTRLSLALGASGLGVFDWTSDDRRLVLGPGAAAIAGIGDEVTTLHDRDVFELIHPDDRVDLRFRMAEAVQSSAAVHTRFRFREDRRGEVRWAELWANVVEEPSEAVNRVDHRREPRLRIVGVVGDVTDQHLAEAHRADLLEAEQRARHVAERARQRAVTLARASEAFSECDTADAVIDALGRLTVPAFADVIVAGILDEDDRFTPVTITAATPELEDAVRTKQRRPGLVKRGGGGLVDLDEILSNRVGWLWHPPDDDGGDEADGATTARPGAPRSVDGLDILSVGAMPLRVRHGAIGVALFLQTDHSGRGFDEDDLLFMQQIVDRAALAWDNTRLHESRARALDSLQRALLPPTLPVVPGLELAARYEVAADNQIDVGGDFYDALELGCDTVGLVIGDVCGRGPGAAAITGIVRHSVRAATVRDTDPSSILRQTNAAVLDQIAADSFCTASFVRFTVNDSGARTVASSAGHPRPLVLCADGTAHFVDCTGTLLGVLEDLELQDVEIDLAPGDAIVLYTDGFTEARGDDGLFGEEGLLDAAVELAGSDADGIADGLLAAVEAFTTQSTDDRALLVARVPDESSLG